METRAVTGLTLDELATLFAVEGRPSLTRAHAFMGWLYRGEGRTLPEFIPTTIPGVSNRALSALGSRLHLPHLHLRHREVSSDGTVKLLLDAGDSPLETVMIPTSSRVTVCVSSQSGCARDCHFCATALMGLKRNLKAEEIVAQVLFATREAPVGVPVRNVVFMGMGEPMDNLEEVLRAIDILTCPSGLGLAQRHVTVSSCGVLPRMEEFRRRSRAALAISLNGTTAQQRLKVMPVEQRWSLHELLDFMGRHNDPDRPYLVEYILLAGENDSDDDARRLASLMQGLHVRVNLIPFNAHPGARWQRPDPERVASFHHIIMAAGIRVYVRTTRGEEIAAACGQLLRGAPSPSPRRAQTWDAAPPRLP